MNPGSKKCEVRRTKGRVLVVFALLIASLAAFAQTNSRSPEDQFVLSPPQGEIPPSFWEQHHRWLFGGPVLLVIFGLAGWQWLRPRPAISLPIEVRTRRELERLLPGRENGDTLSRISRVFRNYLTAAFALPNEEMTTTELCRVLAKNEKVGADLAGKAGDFLRRCDELKFSPTASSAPMGAAALALQLVELGENRRAQSSPQSAIASIPSGARR